MPDRSRRRPRDLNALDDGKDTACVELGRPGGLKGGKAAKLAPEQRSETARKASRKRWPNTRTSLCGSLPL